MATDPSKSLCSCNALISFLFNFFFMFIYICSLLTNRHLKPFVTSNNLLYNPTNFPNATTSYICNESCADIDGDEAIFRNAASLTLETTDNCKKKGMVNCEYKVAFMLMTKGKLPLMPLWERFFKGHNEKFSIYVHVSSEFHEDPHKSSVFHGRCIPSKPVEWGKPSMIDAERQLLANALLDPLNQRFVLLSESCIPLFNFSLIYDYLMQSNLSFVGSFVDPRKSGGGCYNKKVFPTISVAEWRKGSQWFEVHRDLAKVIVSDVRYYPLFAEHCWPPCYMDEHYIPTLVTKLLPSLNSNRTLTWADWTRGGLHPAAFRRRDVSAQLIEGIRKAEHCLYNGRDISLCFLFARKFDASSLEPLMQLSSDFLGY